MQGIQVYLFFNNWLIGGSSPQQVWDNIQHILQLFATLNLKISVEKPSFVPSQKIKYTIARSYLPQTWFKTMAGMIKPQTAVRLLGHMTSGTFVIQTARLHTHCMEGWLKSIHHSSRHHIDMSVHIPPGILKSPDWWESPNQAFNSFHFLSCFSQGQQWQILPILAGEHI